MSKLWLSPASVALMRRIERSREPDIASRIAFWLKLGATEENRVALRCAFLEELPRIPANRLNEAGQYWLLCLSDYLDATVASVYLVPSGWRYERDSDSYIRIQYVRSAVLARAGKLSADEIRERCHPDHWHHFESNTTTLIAERLERLRAEFVSEHHRSWRDEWRLKEVVEHLPTVVDQVLESVDPRRNSRALEMASVLPPNEHPRWLELIEAIAAQRPSTGSRINGLDQRLRVIFSTTDSGRSRAIWDRLLDQVDHDADLLELVVAAKAGAGGPWLREWAALDLGAAPQLQLRAATIAGMTADQSQIDTIKAASAANKGWIRQGFEQSLAHFDRAERAECWYRRFRAAKDRSEALGCWQMHLLHVDLRRATWDLISFPDFTLADSERYEHIFGRDNRRAIDDDRQDALKKTRFGMARV